MDKLLANPHSTLRRGSCRQNLRAQLERTRYDKGEKWWGSDGAANPNLTVQQPLLDGVEGKLVDSTDKDNRTDSHTGQPGMAVGKFFSGLGGGMVVDPPVASTRVLGSGSRLPALVSKEAVKHVTNLVATPDTVAFTQRRLLRRPAPTGSAVRLPSVKFEDDTAIVARRPLSRLEPPRLDATRGCVTGVDTPQHRIENKCRWKALLATQSPKTQWTMFQGKFELPTPKAPLAAHRGEMCPSGLALRHPAAELLIEWSSYGCPIRTEKRWTKAEMQEAVDWGPHRSAMSDDAIAHFKAEVKEKVKMGQAKLVVWDSIKDNPPAELKISPIVAIPHKSKQFRSILGLSFHLRLKQGGILPSVNAKKVKTAPKGAIDQLGHSLTRIIHAFAKTEDDARIFMAKWDIKDGFWRMDAEEGAEWSFAYVLPQSPGQPSYLVVPTSLQMGWVE
jgi:hypothetical protein